MRRRGGRTERRAELADGRVATASSPAIASAATHAVGQQPAERPEVVEAPEDPGRLVFVDDVEQLLADAGAAHLIEHAHLHRLAQQRLARGIEREPELLLETRRPQDARRVLHERERVQGAHGAALEVEQPAEGVGDLPEAVRD